MPNYTVRINVGHADYFVRDIAAVLIYREHANGTIEVPVIKAGPDGTLERRVELVDPNVVLTDAITYLPASALEDLRDELDRVLGLRPATELVVELRRQLEAERARVDDVLDRTVPTN